MKNLLIMAFCAFGLAITTPTYAEPAPEGTVADLRGAADNAANAANSENADDEVVVNTAEVVTTVATNGGVVDAPESAEEVNADEVISMVTQMIEAGKAGKWGVMVGFILMLLVWLMRFNIPFVNKSILGWIPGKALPWVTLGIACVGTLGTELALGGAHWGAAILSACVTGGSASALWEAVGKHFLPKAKTEEVEEAAAA